MLSNSIIVSWRMHYYSLLCEYVWFAWDANITCYNHRYNQDNDDYIHIMITVARLCHVWGSKNNLSGQKQ